MGAAHENLLKGTPGHTNIVWVAHLVAHMVAHLVAIAHRAILSSSVVKIALTNKTLSRGHLAAKSATKVQKIQEKWSHWTNVMLWFLFHKRFQMFLHQPVVAAAVLQT